MRWTTPNYKLGDIKTETKFCWFPTKFLSEDGKLWTWVWWETVTVTLEHRSWGYGSDSYWETIDWRIEDGREQVSP